MVHTPTASAMHGMMITPLTLPPFKNSLAPLRSPSPPMTQAFPSSPRSSRTRWALSLPLVAPFPPWCRRPTEGAPSPPLPLTAFCVVCCFVRMIRGVGLFRKDLFLALVRRCSGFGGKLFGSSVGYVYDGIPPPPLHTPPRASHASEPPPLPPQKKSCVGNSP